MTASGAADLGRGSITARIQARLNALTPSGRRVGETVLEGPLEIIHLTVTDLAERTGTSVATVVRFCQDVGLRGFIFSSPLTRLVDVALAAGCRETNFRVEAMASRIAHLTVLDALLVAVCLADPDRARRTQQLSADVLNRAPHVSAGPAGVAVCSAARPWYPTDRRSSSTEHAFRTRRNGVGWV